MALGTGTVSTATNQVNVGGRTIGGLADGVAATDAVNMRQLNAAIGDISALDTDVATLFDLRGSDRRDMKQGIASAIALAQAPMPSKPGGISYAVNGATFRGEYAAGGSLTYRLDTEAVVAVSFGASFATRTTEPASGSLVSSEFKPAGA